MAYSRSIPLVRASGFGPLPSVFEERAGEQALWKVFERSGLPVDVIGAPQTVVPLPAMIDLFEHCAHALGDRTFGLDIGFAMQRSWGYGLWGRYGAGASTLGGAIARYNKTFWAHASGGKLELVRCGRHWLWRHVRRHLGAPDIQHVDHRIGPMIVVARAFLGPDWLPDGVDVSYERDAAAKLLEDRLQVPVRFGCAGTGILFNTGDLQAAPRWKVPTASSLITLREVIADLAHSGSPEPVASLSAIVALRLMEGRTDIDGAARMAGMSTRNLQRNLMLAGYSYREIVSHARKERAMRLLQETSRPVLEIAMLLGYEDHSSFTRAFQRWMGCPPQEFRLRHARH